jgi:hypothetical protein
MRDIDCRAHVGDRGRRHAEIYLAGVLEVEAHDLYLPGELEKLDESFFALALQCLRQVLLGLDIDALQTSCALVRRSLTACHSAATCSGGSTAVKWSAAARI